MIKKRAYGLLVVGVILAILFLTFQDAEGTMRLSESMRGVFEELGFHSDSHSFRSNAHLVVYFVLGIVLCLSRQEYGWNRWAVLAIGCAVGVLDECVKIILPTREFDVYDMLRDWIGVGAACFLFVLFSRKE